MGCHDEQLMTMPPDVERASSSGSVLAAPKPAHDPLLDTSERHPPCTEVVQGRLKDDASSLHKAPSKAASDAPLMLFVFAGIMASFTVNGMALESLTNVHAIGENTLTMITAFLYAVVGMGLKKASKEAPSALPTKYYLLLSALTFTSTMASVFALRYVSFITRILGKSCKSIPVMLLGVVLGKRYAVKKYVSVVLLSAGVAVFLAGSAHHHHEATPAGPHLPGPADAADERANMAIGMALLLVSLVCDGATGALEDKYVHEYAVGAFDLMFYLNGYKALWACVGVVASGELPGLASTVAVSVGPLMALSLSGAFGQAFVFFSISRFGALTTAIVGTLRKVLSVALSVVLFHHILTSMQVVGLAVAFGAIGINWVRVDVAATWCRRGREPRELEDAAGDDAQVELLTSKDADDCDLASDTAKLERNPDIKAMQALARWDHATAAASRASGATSAV